jgi:hypothetical protein
MPLICPAGLMPGIQQRRAQHFPASGANIFVEHAVLVRADFASEFNKSTRRANHPTVRQSPSEKIF